jgi:uncharacterized membrane protein
VVSFSGFGFRRFEVKMKLDKFKKVKNFSLITYFGLVALRIVLVFIPQYGYIHPDEFFQTAELISGVFRDFYRFLLL